MPQRNRVHDGVRATEQPFYIPAGSNPSFVADRLQSLWTALFSHGVDISE